MADTQKNKKPPIHFKNVADALTFADDLWRKREFVGAEKLYRQIIATDRKSAAAYYGLGMVLFRTARRNRAISCFKTAMALAPRRAEYANKLGQAHLLCRGVEEAKAVFQGAVDLGATDTVTYTSLSAIHVWKGDAEKAKAVLYEGVSRHPIIPGDSDDGRRPTLLRLRGAENAHCRLAPAPNGGLQAILKGATFSTRYLVDERQYRLVNFMVAEDNILNYPELPAHALVINSVTDPDVEMGVLETVSKFLKRQPNIPFINDPLKAAETSRDRNYQRLNKIEGVLFPATIRLTVDAELLTDPAKKIEDMGFTYPILVRNTGTHTGQTFVRAETPMALRETLQERLGVEIYLIQFIEAFYRENFFRKMRVFFIDGEIYPVVHHIDDFWNVHGGNRKEVMAKHDWMIEKEKAYVSDCHVYLGDGPYAILRQLNDIIGLDFCGVDFTITDEGKFLIFELNPTMRHSFDHARKFPYLLQPDRNITVAFNRMIENRLA